MAIIGGIPHFQTYPCSCGDPALGPSGDEAATVQLDDQILDKVDKITHHSGFLRNQDGFIVGFHKQFFFVFKCSMLVSFDVFH